MKHTTRMACALAITTQLALTACAATPQNDGMSGGMTDMAPSTMTMARMDGMMAGWSMPSKDAVRFMTGKYGMPAAMTADMAVWGKTGPWKRTIVYAKEYAHEFPMHHTDVMQQWVDYRVPVDMYDELAAYDGSVVAERTTGELSARCDKEGANFLAINLAHDIVMGKQTVEGARRMYGEQIMAMKAGRSAPYTMQLMLPMAGMTNDPDKALMMGGMMPPERP